MTSVTDGTTTRRAALTRADYARAEQYLPWNVARLIFNDEITPHWIGQSDRFWYRRTGREGSSFMLVDPAGGTRQPAFDHVRLAAALSTASGAFYLHNQLPFTEIELADDGQSVAFTVDGTRWSCDLASYTCTQQGAAEQPREDEVRSPDGQWAAFTRDGDLYVRRVESGEERRLTDDAEPHYDYASLPESRLSAVTDKAVGKPLTPAVRWSPDSRRLLTYRLDERQVEPIYLVQSVPDPGSFRPVAHPYRYPLPGDPHLPVSELVIFDIEEAKRIPVDLAPLDLAGRDPFEQKAIWWSDDSARVWVVRAERGGRAVWLHVVDAATGAARTPLEERGSTAVFPQHVPMEITNVREVDGGAAFTWFSAKSGWGHLYLHDGQSGREIATLTSGAWTARDILRLDQAERRVYFTGGGREPGRDPYYRHLYRVSLEGGEPELLTPEDAEHEVRFSPSGAFFVDTYSRIDLPPRTVLRSADGRLVLELEEANIGGLVDRGWRLPQRFSVKARDGVTDLYGSIIRPTNFDPNKTYPVLDAIYPGPQIIRTPKAFPAAKTHFWQDQALAELGFIIVTIDGMGTPFRSKPFIDVAYGAGFGEAGGLLDHVVGLKQLAARDRTLDLERVGIYGHSGGGYASTKALLVFPEFYKAAVSSAGNHDQLGYSASWGERWIGPYEEATYATQDNIKLAGNLRGKLLLVHGELDDNVHPSLTLRLVDALIAAEKDFEMLIIPNVNHGFFDTRRGYEAMQRHLSQGHPYFVRKKWDHFVRHLLGVEPPAGYAITPPWLVPGA